MKNAELINKNEKHEKEIKHLSSLITQKNTQLGELITKNRILTEDDLNMKTLCQMYENQLEKKRAKKRARERALHDGNKIVQATLNNYEEKQNKAINRNIMIGEDFRSQALNQYHKILDL